LLRLGRKEEANALFEAIEQCKRTIANTATPLPSPPSPTSLSLPFPSQNPTEASDPLPEPAPEQAEEKKEREERREKERREEREERREERPMTPVARLIVETLAREGDEPASGE
jgi:hypothetical protein